MQSRGIFGIRGAVGDLFAFHRRGCTWKSALISAFDYWLWDRKNWMGWDGRPRN